LKFKYLIRRNTLYLHITRIAIQQMQKYYKGAGYVFENLIENALRSNFPSLIILNEDEIQRKFGSYQRIYKNVNGVDLLCTDDKKVLAIQVKLVSSPPKTQAIQDFYDTSFMIERKINLPIKKMLVTTYMPYFPGIELCKSKDIEIVYHQYQNILIDNLISILKTGKPEHSEFVDYDGDTVM
jgi:hypothetical protein